MAKKYHVTLTSEERALLESVISKRNEKSAVVKRAFVLLAADGKVEAHLIAIRCGQPPEGNKRWTLSLLQDQMIALGCVNQRGDNPSDAKKNELKP